MNKMKLAAVLVAGMATMSSAEAIWAAADGSGAVQSGGYWFSYNDNKESADGGPGASTSNFPEGSMTEDVIGPWAQTAGMFDITFTINPTTYKYPFAGVGFNFADPEAVTPQAWTSFCVEYALSGTVPVTIEIKLDPTLDGYNAPAVKMGAQAAPAVTCFPAAKFAQESGWGTKVTTADALLNASGIKFKAQLKTPPAAAATANLKIVSVCSDGTGCGGTPIIASTKAQSAKLNQMGRNLSIAGLGKSVARVDLISLQGEIVASQALTAGKVMNLSNLSSGIYMVRVQGEKVNFSRRITLR